MNTRVKDRLFLSRLEKYGFRSLSLRVLFVAWAHVTTTAEERDVLMAVAVASIVR